MGDSLRFWWRRWLPRSPRALSKHPSSWRKRPMLEVLEDRYLLSEYVVTNTNDSGTASLRDAISQVNAGSYDEMDSAIGVTGSAQMITPLTPLPAITANGVYINGLSQGGKGNATQLIEIDGSQQLNAEADMQLSQRRAARLSSRSILI